MDEGLIALIFLVAYWLIKHLREFEPPSKTPDDVIPTQWG